MSLNDDVIDIGEDNTVPDGDSLFDTPLPASSYNPQVTRAEERQVEDLPDTAPPQESRQLGGVRNALGHVKVYWIVNGNRVENPRDPKPEEMPLVRAMRWQPVTAPAGIGDAAPVVTMVPQAAQPAGGGGFLRTLGGLTLLVGAGYGVYKGYQYYQENWADEGYEMDDTSDEPDEEIEEV